MENSLRRRPEPTAAGRARAYWNRWCSRNGRRAGLTCRAAAEDAAVSYETLTYWAPRRGRADHPQPPRPLQRL